MNKTQLQNIGIINWFRWVYSEENNKQRWHIFSKWDNRNWFQCCAFTDSDMNNISEVEFMLKNNMSREYNF